MRLFIVTLVVLLAAAAGLGLPAVTAAVDDPEIAPSPISDRAIEDPDILVASPVSQVGMGDPDIAPVASPISTLFFDQRLSPVAVAAVTGGGGGICLPVSCPQ